MGRAAPLDIGQPILDGHGGKLPAGHIDDIGEASMQRRAPGG